MRLFCPVACLGLRRITTQPRNLDIALDVCIVIRAVCFKFYQLDLVPEGVKRVYNLDGCFVLFFHVYPLVTIMPWAAGRIVF